MSNRIWLSPPHMDGNELKYVHEAFEQNWIAPIGPNVDKFELELQKFLNQNVEVVALNTGTAALHMSLIMLGIKEGDEVLCQTFTFCASANPIVYVKATPIFIDSEADTWNMCPKALEEAIIERSRLGKKPKAIMIVHLYGMPAKMDEILAVANRYEIPVIEDAAEALGSSYKDQACGTFGLMSVLSFNGNKIITTGCGGALICRSPKEKDRIIFLSTQARDQAVHYQHSEIGYNYRLSNVSAGIGRGQLEIIDDRIKSRRRNHQFYQNLFENFPGIEVLTEPDERFFSNNWLTAITIDPEIAGFNRNDLLDALKTENIESRPVWKPLHLQPVFADYPYYGTDVAESIFNIGLCLPSGSNLSESDLERIQNVFISLGKVKV